MRIYKLCLTDVLSWLEQFFTVGISTHWRTIHNLSEYQIHSNSRISTLNERTSLLTGGGSWGKPSNLLEHRGLDSTTYLAGKHLISFIFVSILLLLVLKVPHHLLQTHGSSNLSKLLEPITGISGHLKWSLDLKNMWNLNHNNPAWYSPTETV